MLTSASASFARVSPHGVATHVALRDAHVCLFYVCLNSHVRYCYTHRSPYHTLVAAASANCTQTGRELDWTLERNKGQGENKVLTLIKIK
jgi:hypothetical protein